MRVSGYLFLSLGVVPTPSHRGLEVSPRDRSQDDNNRKYSGGDIWEVSLIRGAPRRQHGAGLDPCAGAAGRTTDRAASNRHVLPLGPGGWQSEVKVSPGLASSGACLLGLWMPSSRCVLTWPLLCLISPHRGTRHIASGPTPGTSFHLHYLLKDPVSE